MYIVNTTFVVEPRHQDQWLRLIKEDYIPFLVASGLDQPTLTRVLSVDAVDHFTFSLMVEIDDLDRYRALTGELFDRYIEFATPLFDNQPLWFTSLMKKI